MTLSVSPGEGMAVRTEQDKTRQNKDKTRQDKTRQDKNETSQNRTRQNKTKQGCLLLFCPPVGECGSTVNNHCIVFVAVLDAVLLFYRLREAQAKNEPRSIL
jgi:hypothetical protein